MEKVIRNRLGETFEECKAAAEAIAAERQYIVDAEKVRREMFANQAKEKALNEVLFIQEFKGEMANEYKTRQEYVESGAFEKDFFSSWLEGCSDYPYLGEIIEFCKEVDNAIRLWTELVKSGLIDAEEGWAE